MSNVFEATKYTTEIDWYLCGDVSPAAHTTCLVAYKGKSTSFVGYLGASEKWYAGSPKRIMQPQPDFWARIPSPPPVKESDYIFDKIHAEIARKVQEKRRKGKINVTPLMIDKMCKDAIEAEYRKHNR